MTSSKIADNFRIIKIHPFNFMEKNSGINNENLSVNDKSQYSQEEIEKFAKDLAGDPEKLQSDDFGFAKKEKEENEAAALREKFKEMAGNTSEKDKNILRGELLKEEAERLEKTEKEQKEKEEAIFNKKINEEAALLVKSGELDALDDVGGVSKYLFLRKAGIIESPQQFSELKNKNESYKHILSRSKSENLKIIIDHFSVKTMDGLTDVLGLDFNKAGDIFCDLRMTKPENLDYFLKHYKINTPALFYSAMKDIHIKLILLYSDPENFKYLIDKFKIDTIEQLEAVAKQNNSLLGWEKDGDLLGNAKPENIKFIIENYQVESVEQLYRFWSDDAFKDTVKHANPDNLKHIAEFYNIKTLDQLKDVQKDIKVMSVVSRATSENFKTFITLFKNKEDFQELCDETDIGGFLGIANKENLHIMVNIFSTPERFLEIYKQKGIREKLMRAKPENLKYIIENCQIDSSAQLQDLADSDQVTDSLINGSNLVEICNLYKIKSINDFKKLCKVMEPQGVFQCNSWALNYIIENKIVNANNLHRLNYQSINSLVDSVYFSEKSNEKEAALEVAFLKKLMDNYPDSISNSLITFQYLSNHPDEFKRVIFSRDEQEIFEALDKMGSITPIMFNKFRILNLKERDNFAEKIKQIKKEMFKNKPIDIKENMDETAELIYMSYKPIGMDYQKVRELLNRLNDKTADLKDYIFPEAGYDISISSPKDKVLKKEKTDNGEIRDKKLDFEKIDIINRIIKNSIQENLLEDKEGKQSKEIFYILEKITKAAPSLKDQEISHLLSVIKNENIVRFFDLRKNVSKENITEVYNYLSEMKEILGIIFKDNFKNNLKDFLEKNPENAGKIKKVLLDRKQSFIKALGRNFKDSDIAKDEYWGQLNIGKLAELLSIFTDEKIIGNLRKDINKELNKMTDRGAEEQKTSRKKEDEIKLKAYISKNIGSFFAKASAGICTAGDVELFNQPDHFHINLARSSADGNELIKGNIQAYIINDEGGKSLFLRGINPNSDFLYAVDAGSLCDKVIEIAKRFKEDNKFKEVYLSEQLEHWHALSNRDQIFKYLNSKYLKKEQEKAIDFNITANTKISKMYKV